MSTVDQPFTYFLSPEELDYLCSMPEPSTTYGDEMSGGTWGNTPFRMSEVAQDLLQSDRESWRLLGQRLKLVAEAVRCADLVEAGDSLADSPHVVGSIAKAIGPVEPDKRLAAWLRREAQNFQVLADLVDDS